MSAKVKLTIGYVLDDSIDSTDGVQQYVKTVSDWMTSQGHECHFIVGQSQTPTDRIHGLSKVIRLRFNKNKVATPLPARSARIDRLFAEHQFDILHTQMPYSPLLAGKVILRAPKHTAVIGTFHILPYGKLNAHANRLLARSVRPSLQRFDQILSVSEAAKVFAKQTYQIDSDVLPNVVDARRFLTKRSLKTEQRPARIVFLGRLVERKGVRQLLAALALLQTRHPHLMSQVECIIGGSGSLESSLKAYAKQHNLDHIVHFHGFIPEDEKASLLASADLAVFPALGGESFGIVLIEAMASGARVVLGGDNPGYRSVLGERQELLVNPEQTDVFAERIVTLLTNNELRDSLYRWQQRTVRQYDVALVGPKLLSYYQAAIAKRSEG